jgi:hypothetical protein
MVNPIVQWFKLGGSGSSHSITDVEIIGSRVFIALSTGKAVEATIGSTKIGWDWECDFNAHSLFPYRESNAKSMQYFYLFDFNASEALRLSVSTGETKRLALQPPFENVERKTVKKTMFGGEVVTEKHISPPSISGEPFYDGNGRVWFFMHQPLLQKTTKGNLTYYRQDKSDFSIGKNYTTWAVSYCLPNLGPGLSYNLGCGVSDLGVSCPVAVWANYIYYLDGKELVCFNYEDGKRKREQVGYRGNICVDNEVYVAGKTELYFRQRKYNLYEQIKAFKERIRQSIDYGYGFYNLDRFMEAYGECSCFKTEKAATNYWSTVYGRGGSQIFNTYVSVWGGEAVAIATPMGAAAGFIWNCRDAKPISLLEKPSSGYFEKIGTILILYILLGYLPYLGA